MDQTTPPINRELVAKDLERLASWLSPLIEDRLRFLSTVGGLLASLQSAPLLGRRIPPELVARLQASPAQMTSGALARLLELPDPELAALLDALGHELGAWRGALAPLTDEELADVRPAVDRLLEVGN